MLTVDSIVLLTSSVILSASGGVLFLQFQDLGLGILMAGTKNITIEKGATFSTTFTWSTKDAQNVITPIDLTTWSARAQMREEHESTLPVVSLTSALAGGIVLGAQGTIAITIGATATAAVPIDKGVWDIELEDSLGNVIRLLEGKVTFKPEVTR